MPRCEEQVVLMIVDISGRVPLGADSVEKLGESYGWSSPAQIRRRRDDCARAHRSMPAAQDAAHIAGEEVATREIPGSGRWS